MKTTASALAVLAAGVIATLSVPASAQSILVDMKGPGAGNPFWAAVERGAMEKGKELGVEVIVLAPPTESDVAAQISQIEDQLAKGIKGLVLAPTDPNALAPVVDEAVADGVPVVFIDTKGSNEGITYIGTDNEAGAALAAKHICENVPPGSDVALITGIVTQSTGKARADGGRTGLTGCGLKIVAEQTGEWDRAKGLAVMENIITGNPNITAVFASNDNMALGAVEALKSAGMLDKVMVVGFDANPDAAQSILAGEMRASVAQSPANMGAFGVESVLKLGKGEKLAPVIDTGTVLVTKDNAEQYK
jgi:ribose transport system substrate-binding protein